MALTQAQIDEAVMIAKNAMMRLAHELVLEQRYGGKIDCCFTKVKLLWNYFRALACHKEYINATGTLEISVIPVGSRITVFVGGVDISGLYTRTSADQATEMINLKNQINAFQDDYVAIFDSTLGTFGKIVITAADCTDIALTVEVTNATVYVTGLTGVCADNCLTEEDAKKLIAKIKSLCTN